MFIKARRTMYLFICRTIHICILLNNWYNYSYSAKYCQSPIRHGPYQNTGDTVTSIKTGKIRGKQCKCQKHTREMKTWHIGGCSKAELKIFALPQTPFPVVRDGQNLISWRWSLPLPTNPVWWGSMHTISSYRGNRPTNTPINTPQTHTYTNTDRTDYNTLHHS